MRCATLTFAVWLAPASVRPWVHGTRTIDPFAASAKVTIPVCASRLAASSPPLPTAPAARTALTATLPVVVTTAPAVSPTATTAAPATFTGALTT